MLEQSSDKAPLLRPRDVAARLRVAEKTLGDWRSAGTGPAFLRLGRTIRYRAADIDRYLALSAVNDAESAESARKPLKMTKAGIRSFNGSKPGENRSSPAKKNKKRLRKRRS